MFDGYGSTELGGPCAGGFVFANKIGGGLEGGLMLFFGFESVLLDDEVT